MDKDKNIFQFNQEEKRLLSTLGRSELGRDFVLLLNRAKSIASDTDTIDLTRDTTSQLEGRKIFKTFVNELIDSLNAIEKKKSDKFVPEDYE